MLSQKTITAPNLSGKDFFTGLRWLVGTTILMEILSYFLNYRLILALDKMSRINDFFFYLLGVIFLLLPFLFIKTKSLWPLFIIFFYVQLIFQYSLSYGLHLYILTCFWCLLLSFLIENEETVIWLFRILLSLSYLNSAITKMGMSFWLNGKFPSYLLVNKGVEVLVNHPQIIGATAIALQGFYFLNLLNGKLKTAFCLATILMHILIGWLMGYVTLSFFMIGINALVLFLPNKRCPLVTFFINIRR